MSRRHPLLDTYPHHPGHVIVLPRPHYRVKHVHHYRNYGARLG